MLDHVVNREIKGAWKGKFEVGYHIWRRQGVGRRVEIRRSLIGQIVQVDCVAVAGGDSTCSSMGNIVGVELGSIDTCKGEVKC